MKAIMISIKPKWVVKILNGEKTIEIRKTMPKCDLPIDVYIYCTKDKERLVRHRLANGRIIYTLGKEFSYYDDDLNGKVVAKFTLNKVEEIELPYTKFGCSEWVGCEEERTLQTQTMNEETLLEKSCLEEDEIYGYLNFKHSPDNVGYAWHISNLEIFDRPKELCEFVQTKRRNWEEPNVIKAPQSMCYIEVE